MFIRNLLNRDANRVVGSNERTRQRARNGRRAAFRSEVARRMQVESLEPRVLLASDITISGTDLILTDIPAGSSNDVSMDYDVVFNTLTISDATGLTGVGLAVPYVAGNVLTMTAADLVFEGITDIVLDTGDQVDLIGVLGTPDPGDVPTFTGATTVLGGGDVDLIDIGQVGISPTLDRILSPVDVDGEAGADSLDIWDYNGTPDPLVTITSSAITGIAPANITYANIADLRVDVFDGAPANIAIESTSATTEILLDTGASETITFGQAGDMSGIQGQVLLDDSFGLGNDTIIYDDSAYAGGRNYSLASDGSLTATGIAPILISGGTYENVELWASTAADAISVAPSLDTLFTINGNAPVYPVAPGDALTVDLAGTTGASLDVTGPGAGTISFTSGHLDIDYTSIEAVDSINGNFPVTIVGTMGNDDYRLALDSTGTILQLTQGGALIFGGAKSVVTSLTIDALAGDDSLTVNGQFGVPTVAGSIPTGEDNPNIPGAPGILFQGGGNADTLIFEVMPAGFDQTYAIGDGIGGGSGIGTSEGEILTEDGPDQLRIYFTGLEPALTTAVGGGTLTVIGDPNVNAIQVVQSPLIPGGTRVQEIFGPYESFDFAPNAFTTLEVFGHDGGDLIELVDVGALDASLTSVVLDGRTQTLGDDASADFFQVYDNERAFDGVGVATLANGGAGDDHFFIYDLATSDVDQIIGDVFVDGGSGNDNLTVRDTGSVGGSEVVDITGTTIDGITGLGGGGGTINYTNLDAGNVFVFANDAGHDFNVMSTAPGLNLTRLDTGDGTDTVNITDAGSANGVVSPLDLNTFGGDDTLNIDDSADAVPNTFHMDAANIGGGAFGAAVTPGGIFGAGGIVFYDPNLEAIDVNGGPSPNEYNIDATGVGGVAPVARVTIDDGGSSGFFKIQADQLAAAADHTFNGGAGPDEFYVYLAAASVVTGNSVQINGQADNNNTASRDVVEIYDAGGTRTTTMTYQSGASGDVDVQIDAGTPLDVNTVETLQYFGDAANDDTLSLFGTAGDDQLTVAPLSPSEAMVFLGGSPWEGPHQGAFDAALPGVAGGGAGPDIHLTGMASGPGLVVNDPAGTNQLYIYGLSDVGLDDGTVDDHFGFGPGKILPDATLFAADGYDTIDISDTATLVNGFIPVLYNTTDFLQAAPATDRAVILNAGFEAPIAGVADDITLTPSADYLIQINGGDPEPPAVTPPDGDRLNVISPFDEINIYSDKSTPPNVTIEFGGGAFLPFNVTSIENLNLDANDGTVNLIGDNNNTVPQTDNFVVLGANIDGDISDGGYQEVEVYVNGSAPIYINNVQFLNAIGYELSDTLEVTPYADNTPRGWGIDVRFDEGPPDQTDGDQVDLLIYNTALNVGVSEDIVIQPSGIEHGELRSTNGAFGTPIVTISYVFNLDIIVNDNDLGFADTDTLTMRGTNPDNTGTNGEELVEADFSAAGAPGSPLVTVSDAVASLMMYRVRNFTGFDTVTIDTLGGSDEVSVIGRDDGSLAVNVIDGELLTLLGVADDDDVFQVAPGVDTESGQVWVERAGSTAPTIIEFDGTRGIVADGGGGTGQDVVYSLGTDGDDDFTLYRQIPLPRMARLDTSFGPYVAIDQLGSDDSAFALYGFGGDDDFSTTALDTVLVSIQGGDPSASDHVVVQGTNLDDAILFEPLTDNSANVTVNVMAPIVIGGAELVTIDGLAGNDILTIQGSTDPNTIELTPGDSTDAGDVQVDSLVPMDFTNLGAGGSVLVEGAGDDDTLVYNGTAATDAFTVGASTVFLDARVPVTTNEVEDYTLRGLGGDDTFTVQSQAGIDILVEGDGPSGSDTLNYAADNAEGDPTVVVELDSQLSDQPFIQTIEQIGFGIITHTGVETVNMDIEEGDLYVAGTRGDDVITFAPLSEDSGVLTAEHIPTTYNIDDVPDTKLLVITGGGTGTGGPTGGGFADKVIYQGTNGRDLVRVDSPNRVVSLDVLGFGSTDPWRAITLDDGTAAFGTQGIVEVVEVEARDGNDTIYVAPDDMLDDESLYVKVDGGSPLASDALLITDLDAGGDPVAFAATVFVVIGQSRVPDAGNVLIFDSAAPLPNIAYESIEVVSPNVASGDNLLILGPDMYEQNEYVQTAAYIGSGEALNVTNLAIFPNADEHPNIPADQDYFRFVADTTGIMDFQVYFHMYEGLIPDDGNLEIEVLDVAGNVIAGGGDFGNHDTTADARVRIPVVAGQTYYLHVYGATDLVVNGYDMTVTNEAPPVPYDIELADLPVDPDYDGTSDPPAMNSDTGRSHVDNVTMDNSPEIIIRLDDAIFLHDLPGNLTDDTPPDEVIPIPFNPSLDPLSTDPGYRVAIFIEGDPQQPGISPQTVIGYAQPSAVEGVYEFDFDDAIVAGAVDLVDGSHFISAKVEMLDPADPTQRAFGERSASLEILVDTEIPPVDLLDMIDNGECRFAPDNVTHDPSPGFYGTAEANSIVRFYVDLNGDGILQSGSDYYLGLTVAEPLDGNNQFPEGYFEFTTPLELNDETLLALGLTYDGLRTIFVTAEDLAGNVTPDDAAVVLDIFLDTQGPQITSVFVTSDPAYDLFDPKPSEDGPTPLINSLTINVRDLPIRVNPFDYPALVQEIAENPGHYLLVGDANGIIPIQDVVVSLVDPVPNNNIATGTIRLVFQDPLPDDRFTLTVSDALIDPVCNRLDGESNAIEPQENPVFPTGDGLPGGDFVARFTVDSRPELGVWAAGNVWVDTNGNFIFDPTNADYTNRDIIYQMGYTSDDVFAGNFAAGAGDVADGFDKLAVYGRVGGQWRWLVDTDNDGVADIETVDPLNVSGLPVAGEFDGNLVNGDEVGVFTGSVWYFDTNHDFQLDTSLNSALVGYPIVGDFDGDGDDDLATWADDFFQVDLASGIGGWDGAVDEQFRFGYIGVRARPVAADMNQDGIDDFGLWLPDRSGVLPRSSGEWQFLISEDPDRPGVSMSVLDRIDVDPITGENRVTYTPVPFGPDMFAQFGDDFALPVVGNFDPPVSGGGTVGGNLHTNLDNPFDVTADGYLSPLDVLSVIRALNDRGAGRLEGSAEGAPYLDVNMDGYLSPLDALVVIRQLNAGGDAEGEGEPDGGIGNAVLSSELLVATTPPSGESELGDALETTGPAAPTAPAAETAVNFGLLDGASLADLVELDDVDELIGTLHRNDSLDDLALLVSGDGQTAIDEIFRRLGDA